MPTEEQVIDSLRNALKSAQKGYQVQYQRAHDLEEKVKRQRYTLSQREAKITRLIELYESAKAVTRSMQDQMEAAREVIREVEDSRLFEGVTCREGHEMLWEKWHEVVKVLNGDRECPT